MMTNANPEEIDALARRLSPRTRVFDNQGEFSNVHDALLERRHERHAATAARDADDEGRLDRVSLTLAALLFISPWLMGYTDLTIATKAAWISAIIVAIVSAAATLHFSEWEEWVNFLAGVWIVAAPWILHFHRFGDADAAFICIGMIIMMIALSELWEAHRPAYEPI
jgi:hypothetical protein